MWDLMYQMWRSESRPFSQAPARREEEERRSFLGPRPSFPEWVFIRYGVEGFAISPRVTSGKCASAGEWGCPEKASPAVGCFQKGLDPAS